LGDPKVKVLVSVGILLAQTCMGQLLGIIQNGNGNENSAGQLQAPDGVIPFSLISVDYCLAAVC
jgi:hypothetical protein